MKDYGEDFQLLNDVLRVRLSGKFPQELLCSPENLFLPLVDASSQYRCKKVLIDARELQTDLTLTQWHYFEPGKMLHS